VARYARSGFRVDTAHSRQKLARTATMLPTAFNSDKLSRRAVLDWVVP
jgi:hypothetical protein